MTANIIRIIIVFLFMAAGGTLFAGLDWAIWLGILVGLAIGVLIVAVEISAREFSIRKFSAIVIGLVLGVLASYVITAILDKALPETIYGSTEVIEQPDVSSGDQTDAVTVAAGTRTTASKVKAVIDILVTMCCVYLGVGLALKGEKHFNLLLPQTTALGKEVKLSNIIVDTSVIIDGRIADIVETGFVEGTLIIPRFVLKELQLIADSSDPLKRTRGRRGLDILNRIQKDPNIHVNIHETDFPEIPEVDTKLVKLAKTLGGKVFTNDYNLNKVAEFQQVRVLNVNDLANALKPVILPGETMVIRIVREGKEMGQGVAYLDDGTMVVVNNGKDRIGQKLEVAVTSVLQTSAGRMIFAEIKGPA
jgi:uncharacterized protein YacL